MKPERLVEGVIGTGGGNTEPDQAFTEEKEKGDYARSFRPFAGRACFFVRFFLHT